MANFVPVRPGALDGSSPYQVVANDVPADQPGHSGFGIQFSLAAFWAAQDANDPTPELGRRYATQAEAEAAADQVWNRVYGSDTDRTRGVRMVANAFGYGYDL